MLDVVCDDHFQWEKTHVIEHERSSMVRALIERPIPTLSRNYARSPTTRLTSFKMHRVSYVEALAYWLSDEPGGLAAALHAASPDAVKLARAATKRVNGDMALTRQTSAHENRHKYDS